jgi:hypothetical protein
MTCLREDGLWRECMTEAVFSGQWSVASNPNNQPLQILFAYNFLSVSITQQLFTDSWQLITGNWFPWPLATDY